MKRDPVSHVRHADRALPTQKNREKKDKNIIYILLAMIRVEILESEQRIHRRKVVSLHDRPENGQRGGLVQTCTADQGPERGPKGQTESDSYRTPNTRRAIIIDNANCVLATPNIGRLVLLLRIT